MGRVSGHPGPTLDLPLDAGRASVALTLLLDPLKCIYVFPPFLFWVHPKRFKLDPGCQDGPG